MKKCLECFGTCNVLEIDRFVPGCGWQYKSVVCPECKGLGSVPANHKYAPRYVTPTKKP